MFSNRKTIVFEFAFAQKVPLHTLFVFFPITVLFLDSQKRIKEQAIIRPFSFYFPQQKAKYIVELPFETKRKIGEYVRFK